MADREKISALFINFISAAGWIVIINAAAGFSRPENILIYLILLLFIGITESYPISLIKGQSSLGFPIIYTFSFLFDQPAVIAGFAAVITLVNIKAKRPWRVVFFNPALLSISLLAAYSIAPAAVEAAEAAGMEQFFVLIVHLGAFTLSYYGINNLLVDLVLFMRPQQYTRRQWVQKTLSETIIMALSFLYGVLMFNLGSEDRGPFDVFAFFFFFSPLVGFSLLSATAARLRIQRNKLKQLYDVSMVLNKGIASGKWMEDFRGPLEGLLEADAVLFITKDGDRWKKMIAAGRVEDKKLEGRATEHIQHVSSTVIYPNRKKDGGPLSDFFSPAVKSLLYAPVTLDDKTIGILLAGRSRTHSFSTDDIRSITSLANQLAVIWRSKALIAEQEKHKILEERNRIAREIHDGLAQSLAGAVMNLDTAVKQQDASPEHAKKLIEEAASRLRSSMQELRNSIHALRPYPTERVGLKQAIEAKAAAADSQTPIKVNFQQRGTEYELDSDIEKIMFDIFQESMANAIKHSRAQTIDVLLSYQKNQTLLQISDDGKGFSLLDAMLKAKNGSHFGILNMNEQAENLDAALQIDSKKGEGTVIQFIVPKEKERVELDQRRIGR
ncbi:GAF domain-containing sensor histidine kinase [Bacillus marinisedimentorum]|uniref:sensor histidine kinase n=1 Tax=Bacillus marinisedimentorum TaxID=1821260 RepID=UPI00087237D4|nr:GAF domain-containing sensor histidine kinase [Bacillus marinisedimentorum]